MAGEVLRSTIIIYSFPIVLVLPSATDRINVFVPDRSYAASATDRAKSTRRSWVSFNLTFSIAHVAIINHIRI